MIYPVDNAIHLLNLWGLNYNSSHEMHKKGLARMASSIVVPVLKKIKLIESQILLLRLINETGRGNRGQFRQPVQSKAFSHFFMLNRKIEQVEKVMLASRNNNQ